MDIEAGLRGLRGSEDGCNLDAAGSRNSLSSNLGMKRWCTEENLSSYENSIAGSKTDLLEEGQATAMIHGSHSNSTDSGIQGSLDFAPEIELQFYRVTHQIWLTLIWVLHPSCLATQPFLPKSPPPKQNLADSGIAKIRVNPTQLPT